jgi:hypothetical protein
MLRELRQQSDIHIDPSALPASAGKPAEQEAQ